MATTANVDDMARTAYEMAEAQRDAFEALAETSPQPSAAVSESPKADSSS